MPHVLQGYFNSQKREILYIILIEAGLSSQVKLNLDFSEFWSNA